MAKTYTTSSGITVDMEALRSRNAREIAAGNMKVNARGDEIDKGGKIVRKAQDIYRAQHAEHSTSTVKNVSIRQHADDETPAPVTKRKKKEVKLDNGDIVIVDQEQNPEADLE